MAVPDNDIHQINQILMLDWEFDNNIEADCIQVRVQDEGTQGEWESVEIKQEMQEAMEEDIDENDDSSFNRPKSAEPGSPLLRRALSPDRLHPRTAEVGKKSISPLCNPPLIVNTTPKMTQTTSRPTTEVSPLPSRALHTSPMASLTSDVTIGMHIIENKIITIKIGL